MEVDVFWIWIRDNVINIRSNRGDKKSCFWKRFIDLRASKLAWYFKVGDRNVKILISVSLIGAFYQKLTDSRKTLKFWGRD